MTEPEPALPDGYPQLLEDLKRTLAAARWRTQRIVNTELLTLYWQLGDAVLQRQQAEGWGTRVIDRLATDLRAAFPGVRDLSRRNLTYMRTFAAAYPGLVAQQPAAPLPWGHVTVLLDKLPEPAVRDWYAAAAAEHGWSRNVLTHQIASGLHRRIGAAPSNFPAQLPDADSELAQQLTRDPYVLDFLDLTGPAAERDLEHALIARLQAFLLELGHGFAFVGRQYHFEIDGDDFYIDLLFFNWAQSRFVVIELKIDRFRPDYTGQLGFYVAWVDDNLRDQHRHSPPSGSCCAPAATTTSSATASPTPPPPWPSRTTPMTPSPRTNATPSPPPPSSASWPLAPFPHPTPLRADQLPTYTPSRRATSEGDGHAPGFDLRAAGLSLRPYRLPPTA